MSDETGHEENSVDTFEPVPDSFDPYAHIPTVIAIGSRFALDPLINEIPKQGYRIIVTSDPNLATQEAGQLDVVIATDEASTPWEATKDLASKHTCPPAFADHEERDQSGKGVRRQSLSTGAVKTIHAGVGNAKHARSPS